VKLAAGALVVALSDGRSISAAVEVMRAGAHDCVARPVEAPMLGVRIAELARRHGRSRMLPAGSVLPANLTTLPRHAAHRPAVLPMWQQEQRIIEEAIASFSGNISLAAQALELSPSTIYRKRQHWAEAEDKRGAA
jgi:DNA-binding NtrC family response regulator